CTGENAGLGCVFGNDAMGRSTFGEGPTLAPFGNEFHARHEAYPADVADKAVISDTGTQGLEKKRTELSGVANQILAFHQIEIRHRYSAADRMARIGETMHEDARGRRSSLQHRPDALRDYGSGHREVRACQSLRER